MNVEWGEDLNNRIDVIGSNGNDGEHYDVDQITGNILEATKEYMNKKILKQNTEFVKSDGGSSSYYTFQLDGGVMETELVIRDMVNNDFDLGNIIKASRRIAALREGRGKEGVTELYDWKKIKYTAEKNIRRLEGEG